MNKMDLKQQKNKKSFTLLLTETYNHIHKSVKSN